MNGRTLAELDNPVRKGVGQPVPWAPISVEDFEKEMQETHVVHFSDDVIHMDTVPLCGDEFWKDCTNSWELTTCKQCLSLRPT